MSTGGLCDEPQLVVIRLKVCCVLERLHNHIALHVVNCRKLRIVLTSLRILQRISIGKEIVIDVRLSDFSSLCGKKNTPLDHVFQLPNISRPRITVEMIK